MNDSGQNIGISAKEGNGREIMKRMIEYLREKEWEYIDKGIETGDVMLENRPRESIPLPEEMFPREVVLVEGNFVPGFMETFAGKMVSQAFKDCVDRLEPGHAHQFIPVTICRKDGGRYPGRFYFFTATNTVDALNPEKGGFSPIGGESQWKNPSRSYQIESWDDMAVYKDRINGLATWYDIRFGDDLFISDEMKTCLEENGVDGWAVRYYMQDL